MKTAALDHLDPAVASMVKTNFPELPPIKGLWESLPAESIPQTQGTNETQRLMLFADHEHDSGWAWVPDVLKERRPGCPYVLTELSGGKSIDYTLTWRQYWRQVPHTYTHVHPGEGFTKAFKSSSGVSRSQAETFSAELGVDIGGLGAKLQATFETSITTSEEQSEETQYTVGDPEQGEVRVWVLWQLVDEIVALDAQGNVLDIGTQTGVVALPEGGPFAIWGCFLRYLDDQQKFPSQIFIPAQADFPECSAPAGISMGPLGPMGFAPNPEGS